MRILWLKSELLHPLDKGGKIRTYQMLKHLKREHRVTYLSFLKPDDPISAIDASSEYCHRLVNVPWREIRKSGGRFYYDLSSSLVSSLPYAIWKYESKEMRSAVEFEMLEQDYDVIVCDFLAPSINIIASPTCPTVLFQHNVESTIWQRHFETQGNPIKRAFLKDQWRRMLRYERQICRQFDAVVAVSELDRERMRSEFGLSRVHDVPTGVDTGYFCSRDVDSNPFELVFTGSMDWAPNEDAILFFSEHILPLISRAIPECTLTVVGRNPAPALLQVARSNRRIRVVGRVEDVRDYMSRAAAYVVPMRIGGGTRLKIYEAMAMGKPVVSTSVGAEGLPVRDGQELLIADRPDEFALAVIRLLNDALFANQLGERARKLVCEHFGWDNAANSFAAICEQLTGSRVHRRVA